jgi:hypothetical protein
MTLLLALLLLAVVLGFAVARPRGWPEAFAAVPAVVVFIAVGAISVHDAAAEGAGLLRVVTFLGGASVREHDPEQRIAALASEFHEQWRRTQLREDGTYEPREKTTKDQAWIVAHGIDKVDIANTMFAELPADWQAENIAAAEVVVGIIDQHDSQIDLDDPKTRNDVGEAVHAAWLSRNEWAKDGELGAPFDRLSAEDQEKDLAQIRTALELFADNRDGNAHAERGPDEAPDRAAAAGASIDDVIADHPYIALLGDATSYPKTDPARYPGRSGEELRTAKSIALLRRFHAADQPGLLGDDPQALAPGYRIYASIVGDGLRYLGDGDVDLGAARMETILSVHDLAKSDLVSRLAETAHGITDHDLALSALVKHNFTALDGHVAPDIVATLREKVLGDQVIRDFFSGPRGLDPAFNVGRHLQGEADFQLFRSTVHGMSPASLAEFTLDLLGSDGHQFPNGPALDSLAPDARARVVGLLQDTSGFDLGFSPRVFEAMRTQIGTGPAYTNLISIIDQISRADPVTGHHSGVLTINLDNKHDWTTLHPGDTVEVVLSPPTAPGPST